MDLYVITATYIPAPLDVDTLVAVGYTKEAALETIEIYIDIAGREIIHTDCGILRDHRREDWMVSDPHQMPVEGQPNEVTPVWQTELFTDDEREEIFSAVSEEVRDSLKEYTRDECDKLELVECIGYLDGDVEQTVLFLNKLKNAELLPTGNWAEVWKFAKRFGLIDENEMPVTPLGHSYINEWS